MSKTALVLFAHGARDPEWASPMRRVCAAVRAQAPDLRVELAFLEFMAPDLRDRVESLLGDGFERIVVLPMFIAQGGHLKRDVPLLLEELRTLHPQTCFELACAVGEAEAVVQAMAAHVLALAGESQVDKWISA
jgi:sirohydrochlorin cobaltochelatase